VISIYSTMSADDIAQIMTHVPDKSAIADLTAMDEKKAGKVLAALPADRAAKLCELMASRKPIIVPPPGPAKAL
jgi:flagellar motility protein MotE (MotC chaperone)